MAPLFLPAEVCTAVYLLVTGGMLLKHGLFGRGPPRQLMGPLLLIALFGCLQSWGTSDLRFFAQDFWRASKPLLILFSGFAAVVLLPARIPFRLLVASVGLGYALIDLVRLALACVLRGALPLELADIVVYGRHPQRQRTPESAGFTSPLTAAAGYAVVGARCCSSARSWLPCCSRPSGRGSSPRASMLP